MTAATDSEIRCQISGGLPASDSPAVHARARARMTDTKRDVKPDKVKTSGGSSKLAKWWVWTARPASYAETWAASQVDRTRIPLGNTALRLLWQVSNWTDRLALFALIVLLPTVFAGPLRWCAARPTRRYGLYTTLAAFTAAILIGAN